MSAAWPAEALGAMGEHAKDQAVPLGEILVDDNVDSSVRRVAAEALGAMGEHAKDQAPQLGEILVDDNVDSYVRRAAAEALGAMEGTRQRPDCIAGCGVG